MNTFAKRAVSGILFVSLTAACILFSGYTYGALFLLLSLFSLNEFYRLAEKLLGARIDRVPGLAVGGLLFLHSFAQRFFPGTGDLHSLILVLLLVGIAWTPVRGVLRADHGSFLSWAGQLLGIVYVALPFALTTHLVTPAPPSSGQYSGVVLLLVMAFVWINDTGAYLSGWAFGRHKMIERISPKKTWEGFVGGLVLAAVLGWVAGHFLWDDNGLRWPLVALLTAFSSVLGDLIESLLKRSVGVKDSGRFLPGHGGFLDRFDAMLLAVPVAVVATRVLVVS